MLHKFTLNMMPKIFRESSYFRTNSSPQENEVNVFRGSEVENEDDALTCPRPNNTTTN